MPQNRLHCIQVKRTDLMTRSAAYKLQAIADRRAAAAERRAEIQATGKNEITERRKLYNLV